MNATLEHGEAAVATSKKLAKLSRKMSWLGDKILDIIWMIGYAVAYAFAWALGSMYYEKVKEYDKKVSIRFGFLIPLATMFGGALLMLYGEYISRGAKDVIDWLLPNFMIGDLKGHRLAGGSVILILAVGILFRAFALNMSYLYRNVIGHNWWIDGSDFSYVVKRGNTADVEFAIVLPLGGWFNRAGDHGSGIYFAESCAHRPLKGWRVKPVRMGEDAWMAKIIDPTGRSVITTTEGAFRLLKSMSIDNILGGWGIYDLIPKLVEGRIRLISRLDEAASAHRNEVQKLNQDLETAQHLGNALIGIALEAIRDIEGTKSFIKSPQGAAVRAEIVRKLKKHVPEGHPLREQVCHQKD